MENLNNTDKGSVNAEKELRISDVIKRIRELKIQYHECYGKYITKQETSYLERCEEIEHIFNELDIEYVL
jgi:hypothetical protein